MPISPLSTVAAAVVLGVGGQVLATLSRLPAIIFLLLLGVISGPYLLNIVQPAQLGTALPVIVSAFLSIILFEGAITLRPELIRQALEPVRRLITLGAILTLLGTAILSRWITRLPWPPAFLFASLIVVTGPTVIAPILRRVRLLPRLHAVLKSESILIDPVGVFIAVVTFEYIIGLVRQDASWSQAIVGFVSRVGVGSLVGGLAGTAVVALVRLPFFHRRENEQLVNLGFLGLALATFAEAERWQSESGVMAVIVAGLILAASPIPFRKELEKFKEQVTTLGVSILFILLSANLNLSLLLGAGWREALLLAALILLVRPGSVFLSTIGTGLSRREKLFLGLMAPRGILAAAMASYFAGQIRPLGADLANRIELLVFLTIGATVCLQASWAAALARWLGVKPVRPGGVLLVGINEWSLTLAGQLQARGRPIVFLDTSPIKCQLAAEQGFPVQQGDATDWDTYAQIDLSLLGVLVAMTPNDAVNTLACEAASNWLKTKHILQVVGKPGKEGRRPKVRMAGRWAMPCPYSHQEVIARIGQGNLSLDAETCLETTRIVSSVATGRGLLVPMLIENGRQLQIAVEGEVCPAGGVILGLGRTRSGPDHLPPESLVRAG